MTIAACYLSPEGVVFGADSTSTYTTGGLTRHYNYAQKLFEIGVDSTLATVTWGLGGLSFDSHRRLLAMFADTSQPMQMSSIEDVTNKWIDFFWSHYSTSHAYNDTSTGPVGFCIGGYLTHNHMPAASSCVFNPRQPKPASMPATPTFNFWGAPNMVSRLIFGWDQRLRDSILTSGKWNGTVDELDQILQAMALGHQGVMPIRDAIDFVYTCIYSTIKGYKFSHFAQICGGPIEIGVITTDRPFRWVRHKPWDSAISEGDLPCL